jgi:diacylglycerol kinase family enzyme
LSAPIPVIVNRSGGAASAKGDALEGEIEKAFADAGQPIALQLVEGRDIEAAVTEASSTPLVVVGGGDGTLGTAAGILSKAGATLGILPVGTRNHLALALGIPPALPDAAKLIAGGSTRRIDIARLNGRAFVNNASIGLYPEFVRERDAMALSKRLATLPATVKTLRTMQDQQLCLHMDGEDREVTTPLLFVGNNHYTLERGRLGQRDALDGGVLAVYAVSPRPTAALLGFALRMLAGRGDPARDFAAIGDTPGLEIRCEGETIRVAIDGEVDDFVLPLCFTLEHSALRVVAPLEQAGGTP